MLLIQSLASSTLSARRPIDCDAAGPAGDGIMGGSRSVADGCARGLTPSGPQVRARHRRSPSEGVARLWFGRQNRGDADQSDHPDAPRRRGGLYRTPLRRGRQRRHTTDPVKIITNPAGGYLDVYHTGNKVNLASSTDLVNWVFRRTLDPQATQPTMCALSTGGFLTATEFTTWPGPVACSGSGTTRTCRRCWPARSTVSGRSPDRCPRATRAPRTSTRCR